jgi:hypothetical protein
MAPPSSPALAENRDPISSVGPSVSMPPPASGMISGKYGIDDHTAVAE